MSINSTQRRWIYIGIAGLVVIVLAFFSPENETDIPSQGNRKTVQGASPSPVVAAAPEKQKTSAAATTTTAATTTASCATAISLFWHGQFHRSR